MDKLTELEQRIIELQKELLILRNEENKSCAEKAYKEVYGKYPELNVSMNDWEAITWRAFKNGWDARRRQQYNLENINDRD
jgi:hypothetical protein